MVTKLTWLKIMVHGCSNSLFCNSFVQCHPYWCYTCVHNFTLPSTLLQTVKHDNLYVYAYTIGRYYSSWTSQSGGAYRGSQNSHTSWSGCQPPRQGTLCILIHQCIHGNTDCGTVPVIVWWWIIAWRYTMWCATSHALQHSMSKRLCITFCRMVGHHWCWHPIWDTKMW